MPQSVLLKRFTQVKEEPQRGGGHKRKRIGNTLDYTRKPKTPKHHYYLPEALIHVGKASNARRAITLEDCPDKSLF